MVCPIFFTEDDASTARLHNLISKELECQDSKLYQIPSGMRAEKAFETVRAVMAGRDIKFVGDRTMEDPFQAEAWYYGVTRVKKHQLVMRVSVLEQRDVIEIFAAAPQPAALTGLLAELGHDLEERLKEQGRPVQQITNITFKDSIINRSPLLFTEGDGETEVRDSVVSRSSIGGSEPVTKSNDEARPPAAGSDDAPPLADDEDEEEDLEAGKKRIQDLLERSRKGGKPPPHSWSWEDDVVSLYLERFSDAKLPMREAEIVERRNLRSVGNLGMRKSNFRYLVTGGATGLDRVKVQQRSVFEEYGEIEEMAYREEVIKILQDDLGVNP